jgi:hypothetical protein
MFFGTMNQEMFLMWKVKLSHAARREFYKSIFNLYRILASKLTAVLQRHAGLRDVVRDVQWIHGTDALAFAYPRAVWGFDGGHGASVSSGVGREVGPWKAGGWATAETGAFRAAVIRMFWK